MADQKISALTSATTLDGTEVLPVVQSLTTKKASVENLQPAFVIIGYLNQSSTSDPVLTIVKNTSGITPTLARSSAGTYTLTAAGVFTVNKTFIPVRRQVLATDKEAIFTRSTGDVILIQTLTTSTGTAADSVLSDTPIEIRIYK